MYIPTFDRILYPQDDELKIKDIKLDYNYIRSKAVLTNPGSSDSISAIIRKNLGNIDLKDFSNNTLSSHIYQLAVGQYDEILAMNSFVYGFVCQVFGTIDLIDALAINYAFMSRIFYDQTVATSISQERILVREQMQQPDYIMKVMINSYFAIAGEIDFDIESSKYEYLDRTVALLFCKLAAMFNDGSSDYLVKIITELEEFSQNKSLVDFVVHCALYPKYGEWIRYAIDKLLHIEAYKPLMKQFPMLIDISNKFLKQLEDNKK